MLGNPFTATEDFRLRIEAQKKAFAEEARIRRAALSEDWMRVAPGADAAIWRPWSRETGEL